MTGHLPTTALPTARTAPATALAGVVLAAGLGTRLRPLTDVRPKALVPVGGVTLLDAALGRLAALLGPGRAQPSDPAHLAVNAHHHAGQVVAAVAGRAHVSAEEVPLGTAGALGALRGWTAGRDVVVTNADAWMPDPAPALDALVRDWDGRRCRLLCVPAGHARADFVAPDGAPVRYVGTCLLPAALVDQLAAVPSGLYEALWRQADAAGQLDLCVVGVSSAALPVAVDCGTAGDYLRANMLASGGVSVIGAGAVVEGVLERCVVWDGAHVASGEHLVDAVRAGTGDHPLTVRATARAGGV